MTVLNVGGLPVCVGRFRPVAVADLSRKVHKANAEGDAILAAAMARNGDLAVCEVRAERGRVLAAAQTAGRKIALPALAASFLAACTVAGIGVFIAYWWRSEADVMTWLVPTAAAMSATSMFIGLMAIIVPFGGLSIISGRINEQEPAYVASRALVEVASSRLVAGRERLYHVRPDGVSGVILRQVHYDAVGDCSHADGDVLVQAVAGTEVIRLIGISLEDAEMFMEYVEDRAARARASDRCN